MNKPALLPASGFIRLKVELAYDGSNYAGWAKQPDQRTIAGEISGALSKLFGSDIDVVAAGRTDAGVHAKQQFIHIDLPDTTNDIGNLAFKLNRILDPDIRILNCEKTSSEFHARFSAKSRTYIYKIMDGLAVVPPLKRFDIAPWYRKLDENLMNEAANHLIGRHDFKAFCKFRENQNTVRTLLEFNWVREEQALTATVKADSFCYSMVRNLIGASVCVGEARFDKQWLKRVLDGAERVSDSYVFPANGLTLAAIEY